MATIPEALSIAVQYHRTGQFAAAEEIYRRIIKVDPQHADALHLLGVISHQLGKHDEALYLIRRAISICGDQAMFHNNLASVLSDREKYDEAIVSYRRAIELKPDYAEAYQNLGSALMDLNRQDEAIICHRRAIELNPNYAEAFNNLGIAYKEARQIDLAIDCYRRALQLKPDFAMAHSNLLCTMQYRHGVNLAELKQAHAEYDQQHAASLFVDRTWESVDRKPDRRLRVGFVSADLRKHPVGHFVIRCIENFDRRQIETVCYNDLKCNDALTARFHAASAAWREVYGVSHSALADQIVADRIDILFDLAGHTAKNRMLVFARKPAPIQITWAGYVGTTGLRAMDYILADRYEIPPQYEAGYRERVLRLPNDYVSFDPPSYSPSVSALPALSSDFVTFGCFNISSKITPQVIEVWSKILHRVSRSRLVLKYRGMDTPTFVRDLHAEFGKCGIDADRLEIQGASGHAKLLEEYNRIDLALDPFPYSGGLTTCEALWMGVPVVTCPGETFASRHSLSHLSNVGLMETIAKNLDEYVDIAVSLVNNLTHLSALREGLRERVSSSPLADGKQFAASLSSILRDVWKTWLRQNVRPAREIPFVVLPVPSNQSRESVIQSKIVPNPTVSISQLLKNAVQDHQAGRLDSAEQIYRQILCIDSTVPDAWHLLGVIAHQRGKNEESLAFVRKAIGFKGNESQYHNNLGNVLSDMGELDLAMASYHRAIELNPDFAAAHNNLGTALKDQNRFDEAAASYQRAIELKPDYVEAHTNLGTVYKNRKEMRQAVECFRRAIELDPQFAVAHNNLANALSDMGEFNEAIARYRRATELKPDFAEAYNNWGNALKKQCQIDEAIACYRRTLELMPNMHIDSDSQSKEGSLSGDRNANSNSKVTRNPVFAIANSTLLFTLQYQEGITANELSEAHFDFDRRFATPCRVHRSWDGVDKSVNRQLRVGFVSPDLYRHPVSYFLIRGFEQLDQTRFITFCYSERQKKDEITARFQAAATVWRDVAGLRDADLEKLIINDQIDILIDLAGHTQENRMLVFARKPAPIQMTWLGYEGTTGLGAIDYIIADRHTIPMGQERFYRERVLRMNEGYVCYAPPEPSPDVMALPAQQNGYVRFGCFNNPIKLTRGTVRTWSRILDQVPQSKLVLKYRQLEDNSVRQRLLKMFTECGVDPNRLEIQTSGTHAEYLAAYHQVDIALDPFPFGGGITTCDALWMGVPVILLPGETFASRHGLSHLASAGLDQFVARDIDDYVKLATCLANDLPKLACLRAGLRERVASSSLCDGTRLAENLKSLLEDAWRKWVTELPS